MKLSNPERVSRYIKKYPGKTRAEIREALGMTVSQSGSSLAQLIAKERIRNVDGKFYPAEQKQMGVSPNMSLLNYCLAKVREDRV